MGPGQAHRGAWRLGPLLLAFASLLLAAFAGPVQADLTRAVAGLNQLCRNAMESPDTEQALRICRRIRFDVGKLAPGSSAEVQALVSLGEVQRSVGNQVDADSYYSEALSLVDGGKNDALALQLIETLVEVKVSRGKFLEAAAVMGRALALQARHAPGDTLGRLRLELKQADIQSQSHQYLVAEDHYAAVLQTLSTLPAANSALTATAVQGLAETLERQQKFERAEQQYLRLLALGEPAIPSTSSRPLDALQLNDRLGYVIEQQGRVGEAIGYYQQALGLLTAANDTVSLTGDHQADIANLDARIGALQATQSRTAGR